MLVINGAIDFQRIALTENDFINNNLGYSVAIDRNYTWQSNIHKPLSKGKYKVTYNNINYFMTYLDELEMFLNVVIQ